MFDVQLLMQPIPCVPRLLAFLDNGIKADICQKLNCQKKYEHNYWIMAWHVHVLQHLPTGV
jgi:hypothetical protein